MRVLLGAAILLALIQCSTAAFDFTSCNVTKGCWFQPPECNANNINVCKSGVEWELRPDGVLFTIQAYTDDLDATRPHYLAVGLSLNQRMDDDTVFECIRRADGESRVQLSFNDETSNEVMLEATNILVREQIVTFEDGLLSCSAVVLFEGREQLPIEEQFKVHNMQERPYYLLFARGAADTFSFEKDIHYMNDGAMFPWMSGQMVSFCIDNCTHEVAEPVQITTMLQTKMERYWRYRIAVLHGIALTFSWWVLISNGLLIARYFKPLFPKMKLLGSAVWFQLHRDMHIIALILQIVAVVFIFWQSGWVWYECSYQCTNDDFAKKMHAITGVFATALAVFNGLVGFIRPSPDSGIRPIFNWLHWLCGMTAWCFASATIIMSLPLGKTGLNSNWGHVPNYIMGGYIITFALINVLLEMIATTNVRSEFRSNKIGPSGMSMSVLNGPSIESNKADPTRTGARVFLLLVHVAISLGVTITITVFLVITLLSHSP